MPARGRRGTIWWPAGPPGSRGRGCFTSSRPRHRQVLGSTRSSTDLVPSV